MLRLSIVSSTGILDNSDAGTDRDLRKNLPLLNDSKTLAVRLDAMFKRYLSRRLALLAVGFATIC